MKVHPDDAQAMVINRILSMAKDSSASHAAHRDYQETRLAIRPLMLKQKALLERAWVTSTDADPAALALDSEIAALWLALDSRLCPAPEAQ